MAGAQRTVVPARGMLLPALLSCLGCAASTVQAGGSITVDMPTVNVSGVGAPEPLMLPGESPGAAGSIVSIAPVASGFTINRSTPHAFTVHIYQAPLATPAVGVPNVVVELVIQPRNDLGISSIIRHGAAVGTALTTVTDPSGAVRVLLEATGDGDDVISVRVLLGAAARPNAPTNQWRFLNRHYETANQ